MPEKVQTLVKSGGGIGFINLINVKILSEKPTI